MATKQVSVRIKPLNTLNGSGGLKTVDAVSAGDNDREYFILRNEKTTKVLYVKFGLTCTSSDFDIILAKANAAGDGTGGTLDQPAGYKGPISVKDEDNGADAASYTYVDFS